MRRLLGPNGCPWDREQTLESLRPYVIEEAHEVVDAIDRKDMKDLREELGDLLLQIVFQSELAGEHFGIDDVVSSICDKMVRRHPHVFGTENAEDSGAVKERWEAIKAKEKKDRGVLDGVPVAMPGLLRALRMGEKAAHVGLDWPDAAGARAKVAEELRELDEAIVQGEREAIEGELGDVLFALVSLGRKLEIDPEAALRRTLERFAARVRYVEAASRKGEGLSTLSFEALDALWNEAKESLHAARK